MRRAAFIALFVIACGDGTSVSIDAAPRQPDASAPRPDATPPPACSDGIDNDGDGLIDFPADPSCASASGTDEFHTPLGGCGPTIVPFPSQGSVIGSLPGGASTLES